MEGGNALENAIPGTIDSPFSPDDITQGLADLQTVLGQLPAYVEGTVGVAQELANVSFSNVHRDTWS